MVLAGPGSSHWFSWVLVVLVDEILGLCEEAKSIRFNYLPNPSMGKRRRELLDACALALYRGCAVQTNHVISCIVNYTTCHMTWSGAGPAERPVRGRSLTLSPLYSSRGPSSALVKKSGGFGFSG